MNKVWFHKSCMDGHAAAWACGVYFKSRGEAFEATPCGYGDDVPKYTKEDSIYIVDFSFPKETLKHIDATCEKLLVLDHHRTAQENCEGLDFAIFDMERSGAGITWDYFFPEKKRPLLIDLIEDRDLWKFKKEGSKLLHAYLCSQPFDFDAWDKIDVVLENDPDSIWGEGELLLQSKEREVEKVCENAWLSKLDGYVVAVVNTTAHWSEVGHRLLSLYREAAFAVSFTEFENNTMYSLRGRGDFDVSEVAKKYGGGGHKSAAGFKQTKIKKASFI